MSIVYPRLVIFKPLHWLKKSLPAHYYRSSISNSWCTSRYFSHHKSFNTYSNLQPRVSLLLEITNNPGALHELLRYFWKYDIDLTHIESRPTLRGSNCFLIYIDFEGRSDDVKTSLVLNDLKKHHNTRNILILDEKEVPWFPRHISDLDLVANRTLDAGDELTSDHPGFNDQAYRERREYLAFTAKKYRYGDGLGFINYTKDEIKTWGAVYDRLKQSHQRHACFEYLDILKLMEAQCGYSNSSIPQAQDISNFLQRRTGFQLRPVAGLLSSRDFLNALAFRVFFSTQYIRYMKLNVVIYRRR